MSLLDGYRVDLYNKYDNLKMHPVGEVISVMKDVASFTL